MFKRKQKEPGYEVANLGSLIIERVQLPHSLTTVDGTEYKILTWTFALRVDDGPQFFERTYRMGDEPSIKAMEPMLGKGEIVDSELEAKYLFYRDLYKFWSE